MAISGFACTPHAVSRCQRSLSHNGFLQLVNDNNFLSFRSIFPVVGAVITPPQIVPHHLDGLAVSKGHADPSVLGPSESESESESIDRNSTRFGGPEKNQRRRTSYTSRRHLNCDSRRTREQRQNKPVNNLHTTSSLGRWIQG